MIEYKKENLKVIEFRTEKEYNDYLTYQIKPFETEITWVGKVENLPEEFKDIEVNEEFCKYLVLF